MTAELHSAFFWDCDACGAENFVRGIEAELDDEAAHKLAGEADGDDRLSVHYDAIGDVPAEMDGELEFVIERVVIAPKHVTCAKCGQTFESTLASNDDEEEDGDGN